MEEYLHNHNNFQKYKYFRDIFESEIFKSEVLMDEYFHYHGSLTTGTCDEAVNWMVFKVTIRITVIVDIKQITFKLNDILNLNFWPKFHFDYSFQLLQKQNEISAFNISEFSFCFCISYFSIFFSYICIFYLFTSESSCCHNQRSESTADHQVGFKFTNFY